MERRVNYADKAKPSQAQRSDQRDGGRCKKNMRRERLAGTWILSSDVIDRKI